MIIPIGQILIAVVIIAYLVVSCIKVDPYNNDPEEAERKGIHGLWIFGCFVATVSILVLFGFTVIFLIALFGLLIVKILIALWTLKFTL